MRIYNVKFMSIWEAYYGVKAGTIPFNSYCGRIEAIIAWWTPFPLRQYIMINLLMFFYGPSTEDNEIMDVGGRQGLWVMAGCDKEIFIGCLRAKVVERF